MSRAGQEKDKRPAEQPAGLINLTIQGQDGNEFFFRIKRSTKLKTLMDFEYIRFKFDGLRLRGEQTPEELKMKDDDEIDAMLEQPAGFINLRVRDQDRNDVFFRIKRNTKLKTLLDGYCDRQCIDFKYLRFVYDGVRLRGEKTPEELKMEDDDQIDAMLEQYAGGVTI